MSEEPIKRKPGRPKGSKNKPGKMNAVMKEIDKAGLYDTPAIKQGASWNVGVPEEEQDELKRRHNEAMEKKANVERAIEVSRIIDAHIENIIDTNSVIQVRTEDRMGCLAFVGDIEDDKIHAYAFLRQGGIDYFTVKKDQCVLVGPCKKGMRVLKYVRPEESPDWKNPVP